jgi:IS5 family transposase
LHKTISAIRAETFEAINRVLLTSARQDKVERGKVVRIDSTVTSALMHEPSDSSLLWDCVRVMVRLLQQADALGRAIPWHDHCRAAKKRSRAIQFTRGRPKRVQHYRALLRITRTTLSYLEQAAAQLPLAAGLAVELWQAQVRHYKPLIERIIAQTERRVLAGEAVPAGDKLVSLFEPYADIIVKGSRDVEYGHKINLTTGTSGLILDLVVEAGNPADSERLLPMLERYIGIWGEPPRQAAADGGYASRENLSAAGSIASYATSAPASRPASPASNAPTAWGAAPGVGSTTSRLMSGPRWSLTISPSSPASDRTDIPCRQPKPDRRNAGSCQCAHFHQKSWPPQLAPISHTAWLQSGHQAEPKRTASTRKPAVYGRALG